MTLSMIIIFIQTSSNILKTLLGQFVVQLNIIFQTINVLGWFVVQLDIIFQTTSVFFKLFFQLYTYSNMRNYSSIQFIYIYIYIHFFLEPFIAPFASYYCHEAHPSIEGHSIDSTFGLVGTKVGFDMGFHKLIGRIGYIWKV